MSKYKYKPDKYSSHSIIIELTGNGKKVLDIGCSTGYICRELAKNDCVVTGIDADRESLDKAKKYCKKVIVADLDKDVPILKEKYEVILFSDVLEHLKNPESVLMKFKENLSKDGHIIVSLPNIANLYVRVLLLFGRFDYNEKGGILDCGHLRFFTVKTAKKLLEKSGFRIKKVYASPIPLPLITSSISMGRPLYFLHKLNNLLASAWKNLFAYQIILIAENIVN